MSSITEHIAKILDELNELNKKHCDQPDEWAIINETERSVHDVRTVFERTKVMEKPDEPTGN